ncbi:hypothetical protein BD310DRAFT_553991 [Dichomitus squalens]|uniref:Uncharacterized protein n=1 Tax=Dichomitus squalens TaxID=114155 RepID=A0A4Q9PSQ5_9APHY|nr:hypothetical protein BD310DRAFT_553991 [Dichomitus squalens]
MDASDLQVARAPFGSDFVQTGLDARAIESVAHRPQTCLSRTIGTTCTARSSRRHHLPGRWIPPYRRSTCPGFAKSPVAYSMFMSDPPDPSCSHEPAPRSCRSLSPVWDSITFPYIAPGHLQRASHRLLRSPSPRSPCPWGTSCLLPSPPAALHLNASRAFLSYSCPLGSPSWRRCLRSTSTLFAAHPGSAGGPRSFEQLKVLPSLCVPVSSRGTFCDRTIVGARRPLRSAGSAATQLGCAEVRSEQEPRSGLACSNRAVGTYLHAPLSLHTYHTSTADSPLSVSLCSRYASPRSSLDLEDLAPTREQFVVLSHLPRSRHAARRTLPPRFGHKSNLICAYKRHGCRTAVFAITASLCAISAHALVT